MTFDDLPRDWALRPLTDTAIATDVIDLVVGERARRQGALAFLITHTDRRLAQPVLVEAVPRDAPQAERRHVARALLEAVASTLGPSRGVVLVVARPGEAATSVSDVGWHEAVSDACAGCGFEHLGSYVAAPTGVAPLEVTIPPLPRTA